jgi:hypothetical protein
MRRSAARGAETRRCERGSRNVMHRPSLLAAAALGAALAFPTAASASFVEIGKDGPEAQPSCPTSPCLAVSRTTGYQAKVGPKRGLMTVPQSGRLVAWTISLGKPGKKQIAFFDSKLGGEATAQLTVLRVGKHLRHRVAGQGDLQKLSPFFGTTVQFALERSIPVKKGWLIGLTVPTWAPALAVGLGGDTSWRASRGKGTCDDTQSQTAQTQVAQLSQYYCLYRTARLTYSATLIPTPQPASTSTKTTTKTTATSAR